MSFIVVDENSGRIRYDKVYSGKGHAKRALESKRASYRTDKLAIIELDPTTIKRLLEEQSKGGA